MGNYSQILPSLPFCLMKRFGTARRRDRQKGEGMIRIPVPYSLTELPRMDSYSQILPSLPFCLMKRFGTARRRDRQKGEGMIRIPFSFSLRELPRMDSYSQHMVRLGTRRIGKRRRNQMKKAHFERKMVASISLLLRRTDASPSAWIPGLRHRARIGPRRARKASSNQKGVR